MIDSHAHLNDEAFLNDYKEVIENAMNEGLCGLIIPGWDIPSSIRAIEIASLFDNVYAAIGIHPENLDGYELKDIQKIKELASNPKVKCIGEIGLDYHWTKETMEKQKEFLKAQLHLAYELHLPVEIHLRDATEDFMYIIKEFWINHGKEPILGIMHSYSGSVETMKELLKMGLYISLSGPVTFKNARINKEVAKAVPLDRLLTETDSPYLTPSPYRGKRNEPRYVRMTLNEIASLKDEDVMVVEKITEDNFKKIFSI